jgi:ABC-2 type transport system permease protein
VLLGLPVIQVVLFGYAIRTDVNDVRLGIVDPSPDYATLALRDRFAASGVFRIVATVPRLADLDALFQTGEVQQAVVFEPGFASRLVGSTPASLLILSDATEPNTGSLLQAYALSVVEQYQRELSPPMSAVRVRGHAGSADRSVVIVPQTRMRFNPTRESSNLFVPGLMAFVLTIISSLMTAISLTREKETGTMETLLVSPLRPWAIIVGKVAPYLVVGFASVVGALHPRLARARHPGVGEYLVAARGDGGRPARHDAAKRPAIGLCLSGREHADASAGDRQCRPRQMVRAHSPRHHAERHRPGISVA